MVTATYLLPDVSDAYQIIREAAHLATGSYPVSNKELSRHSTGLKLLPGTVNEGLKLRLKAQN